MKLTLGQIYASKEVDALLSQSPDFCVFVNNSIARHKSGDWGDCCSEDKQANDKALKGFDRIFSVYIKDNLKIWIITEYDRSVTTVLFPHEY